MTKTPSTAAPVSVGHAVLDAQHDVLFRVADELEELARLGRSRTDTLDFHEILSRLYDYTVTHFRTEEALMAQYGVPGLETHCAKHLEFAEQLNNVLMAAMKHRIGPAETHALVNDWIAAHVAGEDLKYVPYLGNRDALQTP